MPLHMADIHLHRARLFGRPVPENQTQPYPWGAAAADLAEARRLIEKHGYGRRLEELADAEAALRRWQAAAPIATPDPAAPDTPLATSPVPHTQAHKPENPPMPARYITWLHLSDLHYCEAKTGWDAHHVLKSLRADLQQMEQAHGLQPQMLFFTGDAAFGNIGNVSGSTLPEQFAGVHQFLESVRTAFVTPIAQENVFIVPGNHDVDRHEVTEALTDWLHKADAERVTNMIHKAGKEWKHYMDRLITYRTFLESHGYTHLLGDPQRLVYSLKREWHGVTVGIAGFNTAWACGGDKEKGKLWMGGKWQASELRRQLGGTDFNLALTHHPQGWFVEAEDSPLKMQLQRDFQFHLHGHEHLGWIEANSDGHVRVAAGACYDRSELENGYNWVRINVDTGTAEVWLRKYDSQGGGWVPRPVAKKANDGTWRLPQSDWLQKLATRNNPANPS